MKSLLTIGTIVVAACALSLFAESEGAGRGRPAVSIVPLTQFSFNKDLASGFGWARIAFDQDQVYVSTPDGVVLAASSLASDFHPVFETLSSDIGSMSVDDHVLYVLTSPDQSVSAGHAMWESKDLGNSFIAIDDGLRTCVGSTCSYMTATQLHVKGGLLFSNSGGGFNLLVSRDEGLTWIPLSGELEPQSCYSSPFAIVGRSVLQGGECPLDRAFLSRGILDPSLLFFASNLTPVQMPDLTNRKIYAIASEAGSPLALAGAEGTVLRSADEGRSWEPVIREPDGNDLYPYIESLVFSSRHAGVALAAGFNKGKQIQPYLTLGTHDGSQWNNISSQLGAIEQGLVSDLKEDPYGRLIAVVIDGNAKTVTIDEVQIQH